MKGTSCCGTAVARRGTRRGLLAPLTPALAVCCLSAASPEHGAVPDFFPEGLEEREVAAQIVHEAWHGESYSSGQPWDGPAAERFCIDRQNEFLARLGLPPIDVEAALRSEHWTVDYWSRTW